MAGSDRPPVSLLAWRHELSGMAFEELPAGWEVWSDERTKVVLAFRPDVFNTADFPPACMPTLYITKGRRSRRPGRNDPNPEDPWYVTLFLEPEVKSDADIFETRSEATAGAVDLAVRFARGHVDYRGLYQVPRPDYFAKLDDLTGRDGT